MEHENKKRRAYKKEGNLMCNLYDMLTFEEM